MKETPALLESEHTLELLREIEKNPSLTQRHLSDTCGISLGKINFLVNAFLDKGIIKIENFKNSKHKLGYVYALTPAGLELRLRLTRKFFIKKSEEYEILKKEIEALHADADKPSSEKLVSVK